MIDTKKVTNEYRRMVNQMYQLSQTGINQNLTQERVDLYIDLIWN